MIFFVVRNNSTSARLKIRVEMVNMKSELQQREVQEYITSPSLETFCQPAIHEFTHALSSSADSPPC